MRYHLRSRYFLRPRRFHLNAVRISLKVSFSKKTPMKKILSLILPSAVILLLFVLFRKSNYILSAIYLFIPLVFIIVPLFQKSVKSAALCLSLSSVAFVVPFNLWYSMGNGLDLLFVYILLFILSFIIKNAVLKVKK